MEQVYRGKKGRKSVLKVCHVKIRLIATIPQIFVVFSFQKKFIARFYHLLAESKRKIVKKWLSKIYFIPFPF